MVERDGMRRGNGAGCGWGGGVLGRWSLRRLLLDSPLVGRRLAHTVLDQSDARPSKLSTVEQSHSRHQTTVEFIAEDDEGEVLECPLCLSMVSGITTVRLAWCSHRCCEPCLRQYLAIEIFEARVPVNCPVCHENMHPLDVRKIVDNPVLYDKYEEFSVRRALAADPDTRWCPAPDCSFAVVATGCASCPKLTCLAPGCGASFCYHCKAAWHPTQTCDAARRSRQPLPRQPQPPHADGSHGDDCGDVKPCPRCSVLIVKVEDGSCNHMVCCVCGAEFCWLCMKEVSDLHYLSWWCPPWWRVWQWASAFPSFCSTCTAWCRCLCAAREDARVGAPRSAPPASTTTPQRHKTPTSQRTPPPEGSSPASATRRYRRVRRRRRRGPRRWRRWRARWAGTRRPRRRRTGSKCGPMLPTWATWPTWRTATARRPPRGRTTCRRHRHARSACARSSCTDLRNRQSRTQRQAPRPHLWPRRHRPASASPPPARPAHTSKWTPLSRPPSLSSSFR